MASTLSSGNSSVIATPPTVAMLGNGTMVSPCPPRTSAKTSRTEKPSSGATNGRGGGVAGSRHGGRGGVARRAADRLGDERTVAGRVEDARHADHTLARKPARLHRH